MGNQSFCHEVIFGRKGMTFGKTFTTMQASVTAPVIIENNRRDESRDIMNKLLTIVVYI